MNSYRSGIQLRMVGYVSLCLLIVSAISGGITYYQTYSRELQRAVTLEQQLVTTIRVQAEVAVYAENAAIAEGVVDGLKANPQILGVWVSASQGEFHAGESPQVESDVTATEYPLFSPVGNKVAIGNIVLYRNDRLITAEAASRALHQTVLLLLNILITAILIMLFSRHLVGKPVAELAKLLAGFVPGSGTRVSVAPVHRHDEIGSLADSANALIEAAENALAEVRAMATIDVLTGLLTRRAFMAKLADEHARLQRHELLQASVLMLDLDHFKHVNDQYGHAAGDRVLQHFGQILAAELRRVDIGGRLGGEEFAILLPDTDTQAATSFAERLRARIENESIACTNQELRITASIGIGLLNASDADPCDALARADRALYAAKNEGRNRVGIAPT